MPGDFVRPAALVWPNNACLAGTAVRIQRVCASAAPASSGAVKAQPETLTANAESARWRSNLYCAVRSATRVVPHHPFHERDRGPGCRPVGIIDKAVDSN